MIKAMKRKEDVPLRSAAMAKCETLKWKKYGFDGLGVGVDSTSFNMYFTPILMSITTENFYLVII